MADFIFSILNYMGLLSLLNQTSLNLSSFPIGHEEVFEVFPQLVYIKTVIIIYKDNERIVYEDYNNFNILVVPFLRIKVIKMIKQGK